MADAAAVVDVLATRWARLDSPTAASVVAFVASFEILTWADERRRARTARCWQGIERPARELDSRGQLPPLVRAGDEWTGAFQHVASAGEDVK